MSQQNIRQLREEALRRHRAATRKISRLRNDKNVELTGTKSDPRRDPQLIKKYNTRQLQAYMRQLNSFVDRRNQYVGDAKRRPITSSEWARYVSAERAYNARVRSEYERVKGLKLPGRDETIEQRMAGITPLHQSAWTSAVNAPYNPPKRKPHQIAGPTALKKLMLDMEDRIAPDRVSREVKRDRQTFAKMDEVIQNPELAKAVRGLSDSQFRVAWNYAGLAGLLGQSYASAQSLLTERQAAYHHQIASDSVRKAHEILEWAKTLNVGR